ncbi:MAG: pilus assembly protein PilM [Solirubrobacterales bacterium]
MLSGTKNKTIVGLDVEAGSIAATEVRTNGGPQLAGFATAPLEGGVFREGEVADVAALGDALKELFSAHKLSKTVRLGIANQRVAVRTLHLPVIEDKDELETAVRFQAQGELPMPLEQSVLEWQTIGHSVAEDGSQRLDVVVVAARRDMLARLLEAISRAGLRPVGIDLSAFGMVRALHRQTHQPVSPADFVTAPTAPSLSYEERVAMGQVAVGPQPGELDPGPAKLYCNLGDVTNLAVARGSTCVFTRVSPFGVEGIAQKLAERRGLTLEHARQWLTHTGLERPVEEIDGDPETVGAARDALAEGSARLVDELRLSLEYYGAQEGSLPVDGVVACGPGTLIGGLCDRLQRDLGQRLELGRPEALSHLSEAEGSRLTLSYGLALEE